MGSTSVIHLAAVFISILVLTNALPTREDVDRLLNRLQQDEAREAAGYEELGHNLRNLDALGGGNLLRDTRGMDSLAGITFGGNKRFDSLSGLTFGGLKRTFDEIPPEYQYRFQPVKRVNFDEIDHAGFVGFQKKKKNFDEIDHANFDSFVKRDVSSAKVAKSTANRYNRY